jgi:hypothetical protein
MKLRSCCVVVLLGCAPWLAQAQLGGLMDKGGGQSVLGGLTGSRSGQALSSGSIGNVAGLLQYCVSNNYLGGETVNPIKEKLMGKLPGGSESNDPGYADGLKGLLHSKEGKQVDLSGGGMKEQLSQRVCKVVLSQAKSLL